MNKVLIEAIKDLIVKAGQIALNIRDSDLQVELKEDDSPVTNADKAISQFIFENLSKLIPEIPLVCEERALFSVDKHQRFWLIDPIDGTRSFISNQDSFTVNIALIEDKKASYGFIYQPTTKLLYFTDQSRNFCIEQNGEIIKSKKHQRDGFVAVVSSYHFNEETANYLKHHSFSEVISIPSSIKLCMLAEGSGDVYPKFGSTMEWDIAAGHALIKAAGGNLLLSNGKELLYAKEQFKNPNFIAANQKWFLEN
jgi:3'(2'), 5'-bisphosphate nucleotidase